MSDDNVHTASRRGTFAPNQNYIVLARCRVWRETLDADGFKLAGKMAHLTETTVTLCDDKENVIALGNLTAFSPEQARRIGAPDGTTSYVHDHTRNRYVFLTAVKSAALQEAYREAIDEAQSPFGWIAEEEAAEQRRLDSLGAQRTHSNFPGATGADRARLEREYDIAHNEGFEGFNPYREGAAHTYGKPKKPSGEQVDRDDSYER